MILVWYLNEKFYKTEHGVGSSPIWSSYCVVSSALSILLLWSHRTNRTHLRDDLYAIGKLKEGVPGNYTDAYAHEGETRYGKIEVSLVVVKDVDSVMYDPWTCACSNAKK